MSTHAAIAYLIPKTNTVTAVYLHNDGEFNSAGILLNTYYNTDTKVKTLINLGNLCILAPSLEPPLRKTHNFDHRYPGVTIAYHRDRGENLTIYKLPYDVNIMENLQNACSCDYVYLYINHRWYAGNSSYSLRPLTEFIGAESVNSKQEAQTPSNNSLPNFDVVLLEKPMDSGLSKSELLAMYAYIPGNEEHLMLEIEGHSSTAMGFIKESVADTVFQYDYTELNRFVASILNDMNNERADHTYQYKGINILLTRNMDVRKLHCRIWVQAYYESSLLVPANLSLEEAICYAKEYQSQIPRTSVEILDDSDTFDESDFDNPDAFYFEEPF